MVAPVHLWLGPQYPSRGIHPWVRYRTPRRVCRTNKGPSLESSTFRYGRQANRSSRTGKRLIRRSGESGSESLGSTSSSMLIGGDKVSAGVGCFGGPRYPGSPSGRDPRDLGEPWRTPRPGSLMLLSLLSERSSDSRCRWMASHGCNHRARSGSVTRIKYAS